MHNDYNVVERNELVLSSFINHSFIHSFLHLFIKGHGANHDHFTSCHAAHIHAYSLAALLHTGFQLCTAIVNLSMATYDLLSQLCFCTAEMPCWQALCAQAWAVMPDRCVVMQACHVQGVHLDGGQAHSAGDGSQGVHHWHLPGIPPLPTWCSMTADV